MSTWDKTLLTLSLVIAAVGCASNAAITPLTGESGSATNDQGPFRGRWWSYYDRGRNAADAQQWDAAAEDLRTALLMRERDQRWARTYGLHFTPEYFPHRELGVTLYRRGNFEAAIHELETSLDQTYSARASYYVDEARKALFQSRNQETLEPTVEITSPQPGSVLGGVEGGETIVAGVARSPGYVKSITVNGVRIPIRRSQPEIAFEQSIVLGPGANQVEVVTEDILGKRSSARVGVQADVDGPAISFDTPTENTRRISGVIFDPAGVKSLKIGDSDVPLRARNNGAVSFDITLPFGSGITGIRFECLDAFDNRTDGVLDSGSRAGYPAPGDIVFASMSRHVNGGASKVTYALAAAPQKGARWRQASATDGKSPTIEFVRLEDRAKIELKEVLVQIDVEANSPIKEAYIDKQSVPVIEGRRNQRLSRKLRLDEMGDRTITAQVRDSAGREGNASITIERVQSEVEQKQPLNVVVPGRLWEGEVAPKTQDEAKYFLSSFLDDLETKKKRCMFFDRDRINEALTEQQLSAMKKNGNLALGKVEAADLIFYPKFRRDAQVMEIVLEVNSTSLSQDGTETPRMATIDVAGPANSPDDLIDRARELALVFMYEFPRVQGHVRDINVDKRVLRSDLGAKQRVRQYMKCVVYAQEGNPDAADAVADFIGYARVRQLSTDSSNADLIFEGDLARTIVAQHAENLFIVTK